MTRLTFITIALCGCIASYYAGRANPSDYHAAKLTAQGFDAGRQSVIDEQPRKSTISRDDLAQQCITWWNHTDLKSAKRRFCSK